MNAETMTTAEAAERLSVTTRQIRRLVENGTLRESGRVGRTLLLDSVSVVALAQSGVGRGRNWHDSTAWAALWLLAGHSDTWSDNPSRRWHLRNRLAHMDADGLVRATRQRAAVNRYRVAASYLDRLREEVTRTGLSALDEADVAKALGMAVARNRDRLDGYITADRLNELMDTYLLAEDLNGNVTLRVVRARLPELMPGTRAALGVIALDLADSIDPRERAAGIRYLDRQLAAL